MKSLSTLKNGIGFVSIAQDDFVVWSNLYSDLKYQDSTRWKSNHKRLCIHRLSDLNRDSKICVGFGLVISGSCRASKWGPFTTLVHRSFSFVVGALTGICPDAPSLQHLHLWPAYHGLQKVYICWRSSNHACWWRLTGSGRGADQGHGNCRWISPDLDAKAQHHKNGVGSLLS